MTYTPAAATDIDAMMEAAVHAGSLYRKTPPEQKAIFLETIAAEIEYLGDALILTAADETHLPAERLMGERGRTTMQLRMFATLLREGSWVEASIDTAMPHRTPTPKPDLRKLLIPLGPVVVFGASNFPFAYSTAGGDTASALAAGCPVVVKAHQEHAATSLLVFEAIKTAIEKCQMPAAVFQHVYGGFDTGKALVQHPATAAVGFTGSFTGGTALVTYAQERKTPIPVFSEMGSVNPVVLLPDTVEKHTASLAKACAASITASMGQFCTNPGIMLGISSDALQRFYALLTETVSQVQPAMMLNEGIYRSYTERKNKAIGQQGVVYEAPEVKVEALEAIPGIASVSGEVFISNHLLQEEVFGPYSLLVMCSDAAELKKALQALSGQLTTSLMGTEMDFNQFADLLEMAEKIAGRIVFNGVPTGVEVCPSMVHGGPFPATTDSRFTAVGIHAIRRWVRPVCYQGCPESLLPEALRNSNPLNIWRLVNNEWTKKAIA